MSEEQEIKIKKLRTIYLGDTNKQDIDDIESNLRKLIEEKKMVENPVFRAIMKDAEKRLNDINVVLMNDQKLTDLERGLLFKQKEVWQFVFARFGLIPQDNALRLLEETIERKLKE